MVLNNKGVVVTRNKIVRQTELKLFLDIEQIVSETLTLIVNVIPYENDLTTI